MSKHSSNCAAAATAVAGVDCTRDPSSRSSERNVKSNVSGAVSTVTEHSGGSVTRTSTKHSRDLDLSPAEDTEYRSYVGDQEYRSYVGDQDQEEQCDSDLVEEEANCEDDLSYDTRRTVLDTHRGVGSSYPDLDGGSSFALNSFGSGNVYCESYGHLGGNDHLLRGGSSESYGHLGDNDHLLRGGSSSESYGHLGDNDYLLRGGSINESLETLTSRCVEGRAGAYEEGGGQGYGALFTEGAQNGASPHIYSSLRLCRHSTPVTTAAQTTRLPVCQQTPPADSLLGPSWTRGEGSGKFSDVPWPSIGY